MMFVFNGDRPITNLSDDDDDGVMRALSDVSSEWGVHIIRNVVFGLVSEMTYTVSSGTLNSSIPYHTVQRWKYRNLGHVSRALDVTSGSDGTFSLRFLCFQCCVCCMYV